MRGPMVAAAVVLGLIMSSGGVAAVASTKRIIFADGRLWLLSQSGALSSLRVGDQSATHESTPALVFDICARQGKPVIVTCHGKRCESFALWRRLDATWSIESTVKIDGDNIVAMACSEEATTLLTNLRAIQIQRGKTRAGGQGWRPSNRIPAPLVTAVHAQGDAVFIGLDAGEWGGGLLRIDLISGRTTTVGGKDPGEHCGAVLDPACDPVNAIAPAPWNTGCVVAAVGLSHLGSHGRLVEICGSKLRPIGGITAPSGSHRRSAVDSEAFYGLARSGNLLWAAGLTSLYRVDENSTKPVPLPALKTVAGFGISFDIPGLVVVVRSAHGGMAVGGGGVPDLLPR
jgi:hypothetical protein